jgi:hypothetical protein
MADLAPKPVPFTAKLMMLIAFANSQFHTSKFRASTQSTNQSA